jgi:hypothetical protein
MAYTCKLQGVINIVEVIASWGHGSEDTGLHFLVEWRH